MGDRLQRWRELSARDRRRLIGCAIGLWSMHASLAVLGYGRTRQLVERRSANPSPHPATAEEIADAQSLARLAAIAGRHGMGEGTCLRRALLLHGWLRRRGLDPVLHLGIPDAASTAALRAHAWVELEGVPLLESDVGYRPFVGSSMQAMRKT